MLAIVIVTIIDYRSVICNRKPGPVTISSCPFEIILGPTFTPALAACMPLAQASMRTQDWHQSHCVLPHHTLTRTVKADSNHLKIHTAQ